MIQSHKIKAIHFHLYILECTGYGKSEIFPKTIINLVVFFVAVELEVRSQKGVF